MTETPVIPINVLHLLPIINERLMELLGSMKPHDWEQQTVAKKWKVKDVVAHLLDGNIRALSMLRDGYFGDQVTVASPEELLVYLNTLNADWVKAMKRVSPAMLVLLHQATGDSYHHYYASLDLSAPSPFAVNWAGESVSQNWMHIAREYTEKWLHQQHIRDALGDDSILTRELYYPFLNIVMRALPHTFRAVKGADGSIVRVTVRGVGAGSWNLSCTGGLWILNGSPAGIPDSELLIDGAVAWKLFSKSLRPSDVREHISIKGDPHLAETALTMISVMA